MNLHEYQGKSELQKYGVAIPLGIMAETVDEAVNAAKVIFEKTQTATWAVKAQIHAGGRGKGGGVKIATPESWDKGAKRLATPCQQTA